MRLNATAKDGLSNLQGLELDDTQVTGAGLQHLAGLTNLEFLSLYETQVTDAAVDELESHLPDVLIVR